MPLDHAEAQRAGRISALTRQALAPDPRSVTEAATRGKFEYYVEQVRACMPENDDPADVERRARLLQRADLLRMSAAGVKARKLRRKLAALEAELSAAGAVAELG